MNGRIDFHLYDEYHYWLNTHNRSLLHVVLHIISVLKAIIAFMLLTLLVICGLAGLGSMATTHRRAVRNARMPLEMSFSLVAKLLSLPFCGMFRDRLFMAMAYR